MEIPWVNSLVVHHGPSLCSHSLEQSLLYQFIAQQNVNMPTVPQSSAALSSATNSKLPAFACPSDPNGGKTTAQWGLTDYNDGTCSNYAGSQGTNQINGTDVLDPTVMNGVLYGISKTSFSSITDGTSNTLLIGEICLYPDANGERDWHWWMYRADWAGGMLFNSALPPNTRTPDQLIRCQAGATDRFVPCTNNTANPNYMYVRSYHTGGGRCVLMGDGSTQFFSNNIDTPLFGVLELSIC